MAREVSYREFGPAFLRTLFTEELIKQALMANVPPLTPFEMAGVKGAAHFDGDLVVNKAPDTDSVLSFSATLALRLEGLGLGTTVRVALTLNVLTYEPLLLFIQIPDVEDVEGLPIINGIVGGRVNESVKESLGGRIVDLEAILLEQGAASRVKTGTGRARIDGRDAPNGAVPRDTILELELRQGQQNVSQLLFREGEQIRFAVYAQLLGAAGSSNPGMGYTTNLYPPNSRDALDYTNETVSEWGAIWSLATMPQPKDKQNWVTAPASGWYRIETIVSRHGDAAGRFQIAHERKLGLRHVPKGKRIDFAQFGENFVRIGLSPPMIENAAVAQIAALQPKDLSFPLAGKLKDLGGFSTVLEALDLDPKLLVLEAAPKIGKVTFIREEPGEPVMRRIPFEVRLRLNQMFDPAKPNSTERKLGLTLKGAVVLAIVTALDEVQVIIRLKSLEQIALKPGPVEGTASGLLKTVVTLVLKTAEEMLPGLVAALLDKMKLADKAVLIATTRSELLASMKTAKPTPDPRDLPSQMKPFALEPGRARGWKFTLLEGKTAILNVKVKTEEPVFIHGFFELAICDELGGALVHERATITRSSGSATIRFKAKEQMLLYAWVQAHPEGGDDWKKMHFDVTLEVK